MRTAILCILILVSCSDHKVYIDDSVLDIGYIDEALSEWEEYEGIEFERVTKSYDILIQEVEDIEGGYVGWCHDLEDYDIIDIKKNVLGKKKVLIHELGHHLGYKHSNNSNSIMYYRDEISSTNFVDLRRD